MLRCTLFEDLKMTTEIDYFIIRKGQVMAEIAVSKETTKIFSSFVKLLNSHSPLFFFKVAKWKPPFFS